MTPEQFCYWLQGFVELQSSQPNDAQWASVKEHLNLVFNKVTWPVEHLPSEYKVLFDAEDLAKRIKAQNWQRGAFC